MKKHTIKMPHVKEIKFLMGQVERKLRERPSKEALDKLALFVGYQDWQSFLESFEEDKKE